AGRLDELAGRAMLVQRARMIPIECVARGYLSGSGWKEYRETGMVCGVALPAGLVESERLPEPIFTPAAKGATGHEACRSPDSRDQSGWDHEPPPPDLPADVVAQTAARYREAYERITGEAFDAYLTRVSSGEAS